MSLYHYIQIVWCGTGRESVIDCATADEARAVFDDIAHAMRADQTLFSTPEYVLRLAPIARLSVHSR